MTAYSLIVPIYNEENRIESFVKAVKEKLILSGEVELIFVDDASTDFSLDILRRLSRENEFVKLLALDKSYGKDAAISAGIDHAKGNAVIIMELDSENPITEIKNLTARWLTGSHVVHAYRRDKTPEWWKVFKFRTLKSTCRMFGVQNTLMPKPQIELYDRQAIDILKSLPDRQTLLRNTNAWVDFKISTFEFDARTPSERGIAQYTKTKEEHKEKRTTGNIKPEKPEKVRLYAKSFYTASIGFIIFAVLLLTTILLSTLDVITLSWSFFGYFFSICSLALTVLFAARGMIIRRLGMVFGTQRNIKPYNIKETYL